MIKEQLHDVCLTIRSSNDESCVVHKDFPCVDKSASVELSLHTSQVAMLCLVMILDTLIGFGSRPLWRWFVSSARWSCAYRISKCKRD